MIDPTPINAAVATYGNASDEQFIDVVFDGPPSNDSGRFIDVENAQGFSIQCGAWIQRDDGYWVLRLTSDEVRKGAMLLQAATSDTLNRNAILEEVAQRLHYEEMRKSADIVRSMKTAGSAPGESKDA